MQEIVVIGGGLVGLALAAAMKDVPCKLTILESKAESALVEDPKAIALSYLSKQFLQNCHAWDETLANQVQPILSIHASEQGRGIATTLDAQTCKRAALGYVIRANALHRALLTAAKNNPMVTLEYGVKVGEVSADEDYSGIHVTTEQRGSQDRKTYTGTLAVVADGVRSRVREQLGLKAKLHQYGNKAVVCNVTLDEPHRNVAFERFTRDGAMALLPLGVREYALVWSVPCNRLSALQACSEAQFITDLHEAFGYRLGEFIQVSERVSFPLSQLIAEKPWRRRALLLGSSAHHVHPVAGQGLNLSLRDIAWLVEAIQLALQNDQDIGGQAFLQSYEQARRSDLEWVTHGTHGLLSVFQTEALPLKLGRGLGLIALDSLPAAKQWFVEQASGQRGHLPRLLLAAD